MPVKKLILNLPQRSVGQFVSSLSALKVNDTLQRISQHFGDNMPPTIKEDELKIPDTKIALSATELSSKLNIPSIYDHSVRLYMFGICIGKHLNELNELDREQFYISCILCKIGLSDEIRNLQDYEGRDFELIGAEYAHTFLSSQTPCYHPLKCDAVHETIAMHTSHESLDSQPQCSLMYKASVLDIIGGFKYNVRQEIIDMIIDKCPRKSFSNKYRELIDE
eukprot:UN05726